MRRCKKCGRWASYDMAYGYTYHIARSLADTLRIWHHAQVFNA